MPRRSPISGGGGGSTVLTGSTMPQDEGGCQGAYHYLRRRPTPTIATVTTVTSEFPRQAIRWIRPSPPGMCPTRRTSPGTSLLAARARLDLDGQPSALVDVTRHRGRRVVARPRGGNAAVAARTRIGKCQRLVPKVSFRGPVGMSAATRR